MYLEKLEAQGFKSFAYKNELIFPGMISKDKCGITAIVGPNGSGKSNVADAIRWALGEQSMKTLRGKKSEDIIFSGSDKKGKLGMAEVSLYFNNEEGKAPIDYSQLVITRRIYRNGDSEYIINGSRVRLSDIQMLLAKAKFGQKTYSVIGQGMVEGFLNTSLTERKEFFDEATGVKQFQIKRDDSLNKLKSSYENLGQAQMLITEIEPRLKSLTRQVNKLKQRGELESTLKEIQIKYYRKIWHDIDDNFRKLNTEYLEVEKTKIIKDNKLEQLNKDLEQLKQESAGDNEFDNLQIELRREQDKRSNIDKQLARLNAQKEVELEAHGQFDLSFLNNKRNEIEKEIKNNEEEIINLEKNLKVTEESAREMINEKVKIDEQIEKVNLEIVELSKVEDDNDSRKVNKKLQTALSKLKKLDFDSDINEIKQLINEIESEIIEALNLLDSDENGEEQVTKGEQWQNLQKEINGLAEKKEALIVKINESNLRISARQERVKLLKEKATSYRNELDMIEAKIQQSSNKMDTKELDEKIEKLREELKGVDEAINVVREKINKISAREEEKRNKLFRLQKELQDLQNEINVLNNQLNNIRVNSTRYETKLEDLEIEIRQELESMQEIKEKKNVEEEDDDFVVDQAKDKIRQLKRQLELIGGIDPAIEEEYNETKERFDFLSGQVEDFANTVESLTKIIKELDETIKKQFDKEFKLIAVKFEEYFKVLFNGGKAKIMKVMEDSPEKKLDDELEGKDDSKENDNKQMIGGIDVNKIKFLQKHNATGLAGIEIQATPPGKKITSVSMLSGGERALTAIALICAIISANPSPFVVLDEVDAALDEANSERLASILDELSHKTQFISITHNRATMRKANVLYGVTMGDDGISKLLSVKLDDVKIK